LLTWGREKHEGGLRKWECGRETLLTRGAATDSGGLRWKVALKAEVHDTTGWPRSSARNRRYARESITIPSFRALRFQVWRPRVCWVVLFRFMKSYRHHQGRPHRWRVGVSSRGANCWRQSSARPRRRQGLRHRDPATHRATHRTGSLRHRVWPQHYPACQPGRNDPRPYVSGPRWHHGGASSGLSGLIQSWIGWSGD